MARPPRICSVQHCADRTRSNNVARRLSASAARLGSTTRRQRCGDTRPLAPWRETCGAKRWFMQGTVEAGSAGFTLVARASWPVRRRREQCHRRCHRAFLRFLAPVSARRRPGTRHRTARDAGHGCHGSAVAGHHIGVLAGDDEAVRRSRGANRRTDTEGDSCGDFRCCPPQCVRALDLCATSVTAGSVTHWSAAALPPHQRQRVAPIQSRDTEKKGASRRPGGTLVAPSTDEFTHLIRQGASNSRHMSSRILEHESCSGNPFCCNPAGDRQCAMEGAVHEPADTERQTEAPQHRDTRDVAGTAARCDMRLR